MHRKPDVWFGKQNNRRHVHVFLKLFHVKIDSRAKLQDENWKNRKINKT